MGSMFNLSTGQETQKRWVTNRAMEPWYLDAKTSSIHINGILDIPSGQVDTSIDQLRTGSLSWRLDRDTWIIYPGQILEIEYQLDGSEFYDTRKRPLAKDPLKMFDENGEYVDLYWSLPTSNGVKRPIISNGDPGSAMRLNYPADGDIVIWDDSYVEGTGSSTKQRWITNRSSATWKFFGHPSTIIIDGVVTPSLGLVEHTTPSQLLVVTTQGYHVWYIKPGQTVQIIYRLNYDDTPKLLGIKDYTGHLESRSWKTTKNWIGSITGAKINLSGHQDPVNLNHPHDGDIDIYDNSWE